MKLWIIYAIPSEYTEWNIRFWKGYPLDDYKILPNNIRHKEEQLSWRHNDEKMSRIISLKLPKLAHGTDFRKEDLSFL